jgi:hypothetical protein
MFWAARTTTILVVGINNDCGRTLQNFTVTTHGQRVEFHDLTTGGGSYNDEPRIINDLRISFDVDGTHYDFRVRRYMLPFGEWGIILSFNPQMKLSVQSGPSFLPP